MCRWAQLFVLTWSIKDITFFLNLHLQGWLLNWFCYVIWTFHNTFKLRLNGISVSFYFIAELHEKTFFWAQIRKTMMGFGQTFARMKNLTSQLAQVHTSTNIRVLLDDEHLVVHFACWYSQGLHVTSWFWWCLATSH